MLIGNLALALALPASIYSIFVSILGAKNPVLAKKGNRAAHLVTLLVSIASIMLIFAFVTDRFEIEYVASYSSRSLPLIYKLTGIWAGLDGSLLFWVWLLTICVVLGVRPRLADSGHGSDSYVNAVLQVVVTFFLVMLIFEANPFASTLSAPPDGRGLNPLLQNFFMIIHPPVLYIGYVGFTVPFAYVIAKLVKGTPHPPPLNRWRAGQRGEGGIRLWMLISWLFLTLGNLLGAMWAYVELGWGGFWAWDPVENAGILPWFTSCAFLHSIIIEERRGMLKMWNVILVILTFLLTIFGTFITRSGIIESVHSFSDVTIGTYFIVFLVLASLFSFTLVFLRRGQIRGKNVLESVFSYEGAFYINNILFIFALCAVLWGTTLPLFAEWFIGRKIEVGPPFFNQVMAPIGVVILFLTGIGPGMSWRRVRESLFKREFLWSTILAVFSIILAFVLGVRKWFPLLVAAGSVFVVAAIFDEFYRALRIEKALGVLFRRAPRRYGGYVVHLGIVLLFIGIAGSAYKSEYTLTLDEGERESVAGYEFALTSLNWVEKRESEGVVANVSVTKDGEPFDELKPALFLHRNQPKPIAEADLNVGILKDVYLALGGVTESGTSEFVLTITPLISFVWLGGLVMCIGTILALMPASGGPSAIENEELKLDIALGKAKKEDFL